MHNLNINEQLGFFDSQPDMFPFEKRDAIDGYDEADLTAWELSDLEQQYAEIIQAKGEE